MTTQILEGLEYMHSKSIGHLSLTPCDILFTRPGGAEVKICDFSLAKRIVGVVKMEYGQPEYVAPEIVNGEGATFASDMWSIGIITYLMLSGVSPFRGQNNRETLQRIQMGDIDFDFELWQNISREAKHFVANLLVHHVGDEPHAGGAPCLVVPLETALEVEDQPLEKEFTNVGEFCVDDRGEGGVNVGEGGRSGLSQNHALAE